MFTIKYQTLSNLIYFLGYILFFLMLFLASNGQQIKFILLAVIWVGITFRLFARKGKMRINKELFLLYISLIIIGLFGQIVGWYNNTPGYKETFNVYVIYPLIYLFLIEAIESKDRLIAFYKVMVISGILISTYIISYVLKMAGILPDFLFIPLGLDERVNFSGNFVELNVSSITSIIYLFPFLCSIVLIKKNSLIFSKQWINITFISFLLALFVSIISGRRSLWVIMLVGILVHFILMKIHSGFKIELKLSIKKLFLLSIMIFAAILVINYFDISMIAIYQNILSGFDPQADHGASIRSEQFKSLMEGFYERPLIGHGNGSSPADMMQRMEPWAFELSYVALLYHTGLIGFTVYAFFVAWLYFNGIKIISSKSPYAVPMIPVMVATTCFLLANAANPYLEKFDFIWVVLFFPAAIINLHSIYSKELVR